jgi:ABC-2 type transport system permease protein
VAYTGLGATPLRKIRTIIAKEWADVFRNRLVLLTVLFIPLVFAAIPVGLLIATRGATAQELSTEIPAQAQRLCAPGLTLLECFQVYVLNQFTLLFMFTPLIVPVNIAAYSIVGEKTTRTLEPLLATPITTLELLIGKNLAAAIPATLGTWLSIVIYAIGARALVANPRVLATLFEPVWWIGVFIVGPLLSVLSVNFALMVSSRVNEPHVAEQLSAVVVLPLLLLFVGQVVGLVVLNRSLILLLAVGLVFVDALLFRVVMRLFQRETILTRWR